MITAQIARDNYNKINIQAERFITKVVEPRIKRVWENKKKVTIPGVDIWYRGNSFSFDNKDDYPDAPYGESADITASVIKLLEERGFKVESKTISGGTEFQNGKAEYTVSWEEE